MPHVALIGSGPAALMAADALTGAGLAVSLFEKRPGPARKLFIAGGSGLNITNALPPEAFAAAYAGPAGHWRETLAAFSPQDWLSFIETELGQSTFLGTSGRYFVSTMNAAALVRAWRRRLVDRGATFAFGKECVDFALAPEGGVRLRFADGDEVACAAACFALGGGSYEPEETPLRWPAIFTAKGLGFTPFRPSNAGQRVAWPPGFLAEAEGKPLKNVRVTTARGERMGDLVVTAYGLEGTPIYTLGEAGPARLDLKPDLDAARLLAKAGAGRENLSPLRRLRRHGKLCEASLALLHHLAPPAAKADLAALVALVKAFPLDLLGPQPLEESISAAGGLAMAELDGHMMIARFPGVFAAGEMLDWDAPTGGFLIQGAVAQGHRAARGIQSFLGNQETPSHTVAPRDL